MVTDQSPLAPFAYEGLGSRSRTEIHHRGSLSRCKRNGQSGRRRDRNGSEAWYAVEYLE